MDRDAWLEQYENSPEPVKNYLLDRESGRREGEAQERLAYDSDAWERVMDAVWETIFLQTSKKEFEDKIKSLAGDRKFEDVEKNLLLWVVLPLADLVSWDVESRLNELGALANEIQTAPRVSLRPVSYGAAVRRIAYQAHISLLGEEVVRRLRDAFVSYVKNIRTREQLAEIMQRTSADGGLGFTKDQVTAFLVAMDEFMATTTVLSEQEYANWYTQWLQDQQSGATRPTTSSPTKRSTIGEKDLTQIIAGLPRSRGEASTSLDRAIELAAAQMGPMTLDEYLSKRLVNLFSTRFREVRNADQTLELLQRDQKVGGMGFDSTEASRIATIIEKVYSEERERILGEEKKRIETTVTEQRSKIDDRRKRESDEHAKWYQEKVRTAVEQNTPEARLSAVMKKQIPPSLEKPTGVKPRVADILPPTGVSRLTGLTDELSGMTWQEFRRIAKTPDQAAEKIVQKLETLKRESFERWTDGVESWRRSPLQREYLKIIAESFEASTPVAQLVEERHAKDPNQPSAEEIGAVIALNTKIQF